VTNRLSAITSEVQIVTTARLAVATKGEGFVEITRDVARFVDEIAAQNGALFMFVRHTSASLIIQENADRDVRTDLATALARLAPADAGWVHTVEGPDDMPAHIKTMLTGVSLHIPVIDGALALGTWQGIYLIEHRAAPHRREVVLQFIGSQR
jgi:secondary thiamine-phosphate synthase enzyme